MDSSLNVGTEIKMKIVKMGYLIMMNNSRRLITDTLKMWLDDDLPSLHLQLSALSCVLKDGFSHKQSGPMSSLKRCQQFATVEMKVPNL